MEFLAESYRSLIELRHQLESGRSMAELIKEISDHPRGPFESKVTRWFQARSRGNSVVLSEWFSVPLQRQLVMMIDRGLRGESVAKFMAELEEEMRLASLDRIELHVQRLPIMMLLPLMGMIFPSLMMILIGPILIELFRSL